MQVENNYILGIDPGYDRVGIAVTGYENGKDILIYSECIITDKKLKDYERVKVVCDAIEKVIEKYNLVCAGVESLFMFKNQKTVMGVSEARGAIKYILHKNKIEIVELTPMQIKSSVAGHGHAEKQEVEYMIRNILSLEKDKKIIDDEIDAMAIALTTRLFFKNSI